MKKLVFLVFIIISHTLMAQNVGIGISIPTASIDVIRGTGASGTAAFRGSTHISHFNFGTEEHTYIRAGKNNGFVILNDITGGKVGIGTSNPLEKLHVEGTTFLNGNTGIGINSPTARLSISANGTELTGTVASNTLKTNAGILGSTPGTVLNLANFGFLSTNNSSFGIKAYRNNAGADWTSATLLFSYDVDNTASAGGYLALSANGNFGIGTVTPQQKWHVVGTTFLDGNVGIGTDPLYPLHVTSNAFRTGNFVNTSISIDHQGLFGSCATTPNYGYGLYGYGGRVGTYGEASLSGPGNRYGVWGMGSNSTEENYGIYGIAIGGNHAYGVYGFASGSLANWAGYFNGNVNTTGTIFATGSPATYAGYFTGNVYATGTFTTSDRKLKSEIRSLNGALSIINQLNPSFYTFKTTEYKYMQLPEGIHYGLIADEVLRVIPGIVKKTIQPVRYENHNGHTGQKLNDEVAFNAINYTELIPVLIGAVKEQQVIIDNQQKQIDELKKLMQHLINK